MLGFNVGIWEWIERESRVVGSKKILEVFGYAEGGAYELAIGPIGQLAGASEERADVFRLSQVDNVHDYEPKTKRDAVELLSGSC